MKREPQPLGDILKGLPLDSYLTGAGRTIGRFLVEAPPGMMAWPTIAARDREGRIRLVATGPAGKRRFTILPADQDPLQTLGMPSRRGGARQKAGRKPIYEGNPTVIGYNVRLTQAQWDYVNRGGKASDVIRGLIDQARGAQP